MKVTEEEVKEKNLEKLKICSLKGEKERDREKVN